VKAKRVIVFLIFLCLNWGLSGVILWLAYDISPFIKGGAYERNQALAFVAQMGLVITALTTVVWILAARQKMSRSGWQSGWRVAWQTALLLVVYALVVLTRRQLWKPSQGINDWAMFFGYVNARFFSEVGGISFLIGVVPTMACISGALYFLQTLTVDAHRRDR
jgi:ABC-type nickel/cobalt efflux system permease component RcnA